MARERFPDGESAGPDSPAGLKTRALRLLTAREHSRAELARKLAPHAASAEQLDTLLDALVKENLLSDERYAETRAHILSRKYGSARLRQDLRGKGLADETIERITAEAKAAELERAREIWRKKFRTPAANAAERAKQMRFLAARGFSHDVIREIIDVRNMDE